MDEEPVNIRYNSLTESVETNFSAFKNKKFKGFSLVKLVGFTLILLFCLCTVVFSYAYIVRIESNVQVLKSELFQQDDGHKQGGSNISQLASEIHDDVTDLKSQLSSGSRDNLNGLNTRLSQFSSDIRDDVKDLKPQFSNISDKIGAEVNGLKTQISNDIRDNTKDLNTKFSELSSEIGRIDDKVDMIIDEVFNKSVTRLCSNLKACQETDKLLRENLYHCYRFIEKNVTWPVAFKDCKDIGGFLVEILDYSSLYYLKQIYHEKKQWNWWIGLTDLDGEWTWQTSGKGLIIEDWGHNEPNKLAGEHYVHTWKEYGYNGEWNDISVGYTFTYICEKDGNDPCEEWQGWSKDF